MAGYSDEPRDMQSITIRHQKKQTTERVNEATRDIEGVSESNSEELVFTLIKDVAKLVSKLPLEPPVTILCT